MKKVTNAQIAELDALKARVEAAVSEANQAITEINEWLGERGSEAQGYADERSDKWQESEAGEAYQEWAGHFDDLALEPIDAQDWLGALDELRNAPND